MGSNRVELTENRRLTTLDRRDEIGKEGEQGGKRKESKKTRGERTRESKPETS